MKVEILSTGDEVLTGAVVDTNSAHIAEKLTAAGMGVTRQSCVGDKIDDLVVVIRDISRRADVVVVTGGLGPTEDDLTAEAVAKAANVALVFNDTADQSIDAFFKKLKRARNVSDKKQAMMPEGAVCLDNVAGTAPGFISKINECHVICIPGVPSEMVHMLERSVIPYIQDLQGDRQTVNVVNTLSLFGLPEAEVGEKLKGLSNEFPDIKLGLCARFPEIQIRLYAKGPDKNRIEQELNRTRAWVLERVGEHVFSHTGDSMAAEVGKLLRSTESTLAVAESCTGGLISSWITDVDGSSDYFLFSGVTYANQAKIDILGVSDQHLEQYGAVDEVIVKEMAEGARRAAGATYGLAASGIAGPTGGTAEKPVGTVCIGFASPEASFGKRYLLSFSDRLKNKTIFAMTALWLLRKELVTHGQAE